MEIKRYSGDSSCNDRVFIGDQYLSEEERQAYNAFLELDKDEKMIGDLSGSTTYMKSLDNAEKMRKSGAGFRNKLERSATCLAVLGNANDTYSFLEGFLLSSYRFDKYLKEKKPFGLTEIYVSEDISDEAIEELKNMVKAVYWTRDMVNEPVSFLNAEQLAQQITELGAETGMNVKVLEKTQIESLKMGGILAVNQGSIDQPTFTIAEYKPANAKNEKPIVLVGKGVVYDTGGLSLKPTPNSMDSMKCDMAGAACMAGAIYLAALQQLPLHIIALIPATDNRPGLNAYAPGDIITMYDGTTVEVLNTDAEGRMILADALAYSKKYDPELVINAATLTGSAFRAIGRNASAVMGNADEPYFEKLDAAGHETYERLVRFPFWDEYFEEMKSTIADLNNLGGPTAGMITAGKFLEHFVEAPFIHMDLSAAWLDKQQGYRTKGGSGFGVRLLYSFLKNYA